MEGATSGNGGPMETGLGKYGCSHYRRRCRIRAPCCNEIFDCRHCHNEAMVKALKQLTLSDSPSICDLKMTQYSTSSIHLWWLMQNSMEVQPRDRHQISRTDIESVICSLCSTEQQVQQYCINCGVCMGRYFCSTCKFFDDDISKKQYHCDGCGLCRTGGSENFFHCKKCGCCYSEEMKDSHRCVERAMHHNCPVCFEYLFDSTKDVSVVGCGHTLHYECLKEMLLHYQFNCPVCSKSVCDMSRWWEKLDHEVAATPMPSIYQNTMVSILCNDCGANLEVNFHIIAHKCLSCNSYNTRKTRGSVSSCSST